MNYIVLSGVIALLVWVALGWRRHFVVRNQLKAFFESRGIPIVDIKRPSHITYGFPGWAFVFASRSQADSFAKSAHYQELLTAIQELHARDGSSVRPFDARLAVTLEPQ
jgi:hypothetical protein